MRFLTLFLLLLSSCSFGVRSILDQDDSWSKVNSLDEKKVVLDSLPSLNKPMILRSRLSLKSPLEKRSLDQVSLISKDKLALSIYAPSYSKLLYRFIENGSSLSLIDYLERRYFVGESIEEFPLEGVALFFKYYPEFVRGYLSDNLRGQLREADIEVFKNLRGDFLFKEVGIGGSREFLFGKFGEKVFCLQKVLVFQGDTETLFEADVLPENSLCTAKKIRTTGIAEHEVEIESLLLVKTEDAKIDKNAFVVSYPDNFKSVSGD